MTSSHEGWVVDSSVNCGWLDKDSEDKDTRQKCCPVTQDTFGCLTSCLCVVLGYTCACLCHMYMCSSHMHFISACLWLHVCVCACICLNLYIACVTVPMQASLEPVYYCCVLESVYHIFGILSFIGKCYFTKSKCGMKYRFNCTSILKSHFIYYTVYDYIKCNYCDLCHNTWIFLLNPTSSNVTLSCDHLGCYCVMGQSSLS